MEWDEALMHAHSRTLMHTQCKRGYLGDGYREEGELWYGHPRWVKRPFGKEMGKALKHAVPTGTAPQPVPCVAAAATTL